MDHHRVRLNVFLSCVLSNWYLNTKSVFRILLRPHQCWHKLFAFFPKNKLLTALYEWGRCLSSIAKLLAIIEIKLTATLH